MAGGVSDRVDGARRHGGQAARFGFVGVFNTGLDFAVYAACVAAGFAPLLANALAFACANIFSYAANAHVTFRRDGAARTRFAVKHRHGLTRNDDAQDRPDVREDVVDLVR